MMSFHRGGYYAVNFGLDSDNVMRIGGWSAAANRWQLDMSGNNWVASSFRAPIFYDSDDTGYYIDPNSTGSSALRMRGGALFGPNTSWGAYLYIGTNGSVDVNTATVAATNGNLHLDAANGYVMYLNNYATSSYTVANQSMRSPIFYDQNNTGYYADLNNTTYCYYLQSATSVRADSDRRIKDNIETIDNAIDKVKRLRGTYFTRKDLTDKTKKHIGLIAQEVLEVIPEVVGGSEETTYSVGYGEIVAVLIEAIKEQQEQIEEMGNLINGK
jgi:hypothetical protein